MSWEGTKNISVWSQLDKMVQKLKIKFSTQPEGNTVRIFNGTTVPGSRRWTLWWWRMDRDKSTGRFFFLICYRSALPIFTKPPCKGGIGYGLSLAEWFLSQAAWEVVFDQRKHLFVLLMSQGLFFHRVLHYTEMGGII